MALLPVPWWNEGSSQARDGSWVDSRNKLLNKRKKEGGKREERRAKSEEREEGSSRLLRSSSASDNKSELRPRTRWHRRRSFVNVHGKHSTAMVSGGSPSRGALWRMPFRRLYLATSFALRRLVARNNRTKSRTNDNFQCGCHTVSGGRADGGAG